MGSRRTVSLALLDPLVWVTDHTGVTAAANAASRAAGRDPNAEVGGVDVGVDPLPSAEPGGDQEHHHKIVKDTDMREPTPDKQLRVAVVGDSLAQGVGFAADSVFKPFWAEVFKQGRISTGLARLDYFNWMAQMRTIVDRADPDLILVMVGENDNQGLAGARRHARAGHRHVRLGRPLPRARRGVREDRNERRWTCRLDRPAEHERQEPVGLHPTAGRDLPGGRRRAARTSRTSTPGTRSPQPTAATARSIGTAAR